MFSYVQGIVGQGKQAKVLTDAQIKAVLAAVEDRRCPLRDRVCRRRHGLSFEPSELSQCDKATSSELLKQALCNFYKKLAVIAHAFRISSVCVRARFDLDHILTDVVHSPFSEPAGSTAGAISSGGALLKSSSRVRDSTSAAPPQTSQRH
jgi:hypothetical protein